MTWFYLQLNIILSKNINRLIIVSHLGRPTSETDKKYTLLPVYKYLQDVLKMDIDFINLLNDFNISKRVVLCENIRYFRAETKKDTDENVEKLCNLLSSLGDVYVNDAFGTLHRDHCSITGVNCESKVCGLLVKKELQVFNPLLGSKVGKPVIAILGGSKINDKIKLISNLLDKVDHLIIGGGMAFTFKKVLQNYEIGNSLFDEEGSLIVKDIINKANENNVKIYLPIDFIISDKFSEDGIIMTSGLNKNIPDGFMGLDIGPESIKHFEKILEISKTVLWNGPMGVFEMESFSKGTCKLLEKLADLTCKDTFTIIGGGDTAACAYKYRYNDKMSHVSTGGGASLKLLEGSELIGLSVLDNI